MTRLQVCSGDGRVLGIGVYNPLSMYRVRVRVLTFLKMSLEVLQRGEMRPGWSMLGILQHRLRLAMATRRLLGLPKAGQDEGGESSYELAGRGVSTCQR